MPVTPVPAPSKWVDLPPDAAARVQQELLRRYAGQALNRGVVEQIRADARRAGYQLVGLRLQLVNGRTQVAWDKVQRLQ